jgi:hypothetical protein
VKTVLLVCLLGLLACETTADKVSEITYIRDPRTNLCFATWNWGAQIGSFTAVPCSPEVSKLITERTVVMEKDRGTK